MKATSQAVAALLLSVTFFAAAILAPRPAAAEAEKKVSRDLAKTLKAAQDPSARPPSTPVRREP